MQDTLGCGGHSVWAFGSCGSSGGKCLGNCPSIFSLFVCQIRVPRTQGEPIGVSNGVDTDDIDAAAAGIRAAQEFFGVA